MLETHLLGLYIQSLLHAVIAIVPTFKIEATEPEATLSKVEDVVSKGARVLCNDAYGTLPTPLVVLDAAGLRPGTGAANT